MENCILERKISQKKVEAFENDMGSEKLTNTGEEISYKRMGMRDSLPYLVTYEFVADSVIHVKYSWSNLPGQKDEMINCLTDLTALLKKRTGSDPILNSDRHRKEADYSTRIDFTDTYSWNKTKSTDYTAWMLFHDSGRQGESYLLLEIYFDDWFMKEKVYYLKKTVLYGYKKTRLCKL